MSENNRLKNKYIRSEYSGTQFYETLNINNENLELSSQSSNNRKAFSKYEQINIKNQFEYASDDTEIDSLI